MNHAKNIFQYTFGSSRCSSKRRRERGDKGDKKIDYDVWKAVLFSHCALPRRSASAPTWTFLGPLSVFFRQPAILGARLASH